MDQIKEFFFALFEMIEGILLGNNKYEEVGYMGLVGGFLTTALGIFSNPKT